MNPKLIAEWVDGDLKPGRIGIIAENLYGFRVTPGEHPIDILLIGVDRSYMDFDPNDKRFKALVQKIYGDKGPQTTDEWEQEINASSQNDELKAHLTMSIKAKAVGAGTEGGGGGGGKIRIETKRGTIIIADAIKAVHAKHGQDMYYVGFGPGSGPITKQRKAIKLQAPDFFDFTVSAINPITQKLEKRVQWKFEKIITINKDNIVRMTRI